MITPDHAPSHKPTRSQARRWANSIKRRREFRPEYLEIRDAALWARMRLDDGLSWRETLDQQRALRLQTKGGGAVRFRPRYRTAGGTP